MTIRSSKSTTNCYIMWTGLVRGGGRGTKYRGLSCPLLKSFSLGTHAKKCWRNCFFAMLRPTSSVRSRGRGMGGHVSTSKNSCPPSKERKFVLKGMPKRLPPSDKYRKKLDVIYTCCLWVRTAVIVILSSISCSHYGFLGKLIKNNLFSAPTTEQLIFHQHYNTSAVFYKR